MDITRLSNPPLFPASEAPSSELASEVCPLRTGCHGDTGGQEDAYRVTDHVRVCEWWAKSDGLVVYLWK